MEGNEIIIRITFTIGKCDIGIWTLQYPFNVQCDRGRNFRVNTSFRILVWDFAIGFRIYTDGIMLPFGMEIIGKTFSCIFFYFFYWIFCFYGIFEQFDPLFPDIATKPLLAAVVGAIFVGVSVGLCVRVGGAPTGDDALAMSLDRVLPLDIQWIYLISDLVVLLISLTYIPVSKIIYSLLTVILSGQIIGVMQKIPFRKKDKEDSYSFAVEPNRESWTAGDGDISQ